MECKKVFQVMGAAAVLLLFAAGTSRAMDKEPEPSGVMQGPGHPRGEERWKNEAKELGLTPEQSARMKALHDENRSSQEGLRAQLKAKDAALRQELDAAKPDRAKAESLVKEISVLEEKIGLARVDQALKAREILTPEQAKKLREWHEKNKEKFQHHRDKAGKTGHEPDMKTEKAEK